MMKGDHKYCEIFKNDKAAVIDDIVQEVFKYK